MTIRPRRADDLPALVAALRAVHETMGYPSVWPDDPAAFVLGRGEEADPLAVGEADAGRLRALHPLLHHHPRALRQERRLLRGREVAREPQDRLRGVVLEHQRGLLLARLRAWLAVRRPVGGLPAAEALDRDLGVELHAVDAPPVAERLVDRKSTRLNSSHRT